MVKIKICGMTNLEDCQTAIDLGVDFIGFVFYKKSARYVTPEMVREISERINGKAKTVGVFVEETEDEIDRLVDFCHLDFAQVYNSRMDHMEQTGSCVYRIKDAVPEVVSRMVSFSLTVIRKGSADQARLLMSACSRATAPWGGLS